MLTDVEAREIAASERISAALAVFDEATAGYDMWDPDLEEVRFEAMKLALAAASPSAGWMDIASAPKTWRDETGRGRYVWLIARHPGSPSWTDQYYSWRDPDGTWVRWPHYFEPTHWMDAPAPPPAQAIEVRRSDEP